VGAARGDFSTSRLLENPLRPRSGLEGLRRTPPNRGLQGVAGKGAHGEVPPPFRDVTPRDPPGGGTASHRDLCRRWVQEAAGGRPSSVKRMTKGGAVHPLSQDSEEASSHHSRSSRSSFSFFSKRARFFGGRASRSSLRSFPPICRCQGGGAFTSSKSARLGPSSLTFFNSKAREREAMLDEALPGEPSQRSKDLSLPQ